MMRFAFAVGAVSAIGCASAPAKTPAERAAVMNALAMQCRSGTATYTVTNALARRVAIYQTGGGSGSVIRAAPHQDEHRVRPPEAGGGVVVVVTPRALVSKAV
jgi:hypothetical protein